MEARNSHIKEGLQKAYGSKVPGQSLDVFCVSNLMYEKYSKKGNKELVQASCIPELRQFCHTITADAQFRGAMHFLRSTLSNLLNSVDIWASTSGSLLQEPEDALDISIYRVLEDVEKQVRILLVLKSFDAG
jgi:hypothetical protein